MPCLIFLQGCDTITSVGWVLYYTILLIGSILLAQGRAFLFVIMSASKTILYLLAFKKPYCLTVFLRFGNGGKSDRSIMVFFHYLFNFRKRNAEEFFSAVYKIYTPIIKLPVQSRLQRRRVLRENHSVNIKFKWYGSAAEFFLYGP